MATEKEIQDGIKQTKIETLRAVIEVLNDEKSWPLNLLTPETHPSDVISLSLVSLNFRFDKMLLDIAHPNPGDEKIVDKTVEKKRRATRFTIRATLDRFALDHDIRIVASVHDELAAEIEKELRLSLESP